MPLVANSNLPSFYRLKQGGEIVIPQEQALRQDIRELHIGLLNMMPDRALEATERQFFRLIGESNHIAQFYMHPFTLDSIKRSDDVSSHVMQYYENFDGIKEQGLDALIITGANVVGEELSKQPFWQALIEVMEWAWDNVTSTLCSCLATHAVMQFRYSQHRRALSTKYWGIFPHRVVDRLHPLVAGVNTRFDVPHSRHNEIHPEQFEQSGLRVLVASEQGDVHLAVSPDGLRLVFFQGHPEYDAISLMKEYKREIGYYIQDQSAQYPLFPKNYFGTLQQAVLEEYQEHVNEALVHDQPIPEFPEDLLVGGIDNTWHDTAEAVINNWIGMVYQLTHIDRHLQFKDGLDPNDLLTTGNLIAKQSFK